MFQPSSYDLLLLPMCLLPLLLLSLLLLGYN